MSTGPAAPAKHAELLALATELRPELHRYSARLMGSVIEGEDVVQDTFARAFAALDELKEAPPLRPWLFRIAHNRAMDLLRGRAIRAAEPIDEVPEIVDPDSPDPAELLMRREAVETAVSRSWSYLPCSAAWSSSRTCWDSPWKRPPTCSISRLTR